MSEDARGKEKPNFYSDVKLLATCSPGKEEKAELELLDALLRGGARDVEVLRTDYPGVLLVKVSLPAEEALRMACSMEMAYVRSVVPIQAIVEAEMSSIKRACLHLARKAGLRPGIKFAVRCRRRGRAIRSSLEVEREVGRIIREETGAEVDLERPDVVVRVEVIGRVAGICLEGPGRATRWCARSRTAGALRPRATSPNSA